MAQVRISGDQALGYAEVGGGPAVPILFLHGVGSDKSVWAAQLEHFGQDRRALAFDFPGYGESDPAADGADRDQVAIILLAGLEALGVDRAHVCGLSLGGVMAIAMHSAAPERCASLILADTFAVHPDGRAIYERSVAGSTDMRAFAQARVDVLFAQPNAAIRQEAIETMAAIDPVAYRLAAEAVWLADQAGRAAEIAVPTLVLCGAEDKPTPLELSRRLADMIPTARLKVIPGAGHLANLDQPGSFNAEIDRFLATIEG